MPASAGLLLQLDTARYKMGPGGRLHWPAGLTTNELKKVVQSFSSCPGTADLRRSFRQLARITTLMNVHKLLIRDQARGPNRLVRGVYAVGFLGMLLVVSWCIKLLSNETRYVADAAGLPPLSLK